MSQLKEIRAALLSGQRLTPADAWKRFGCYRLGARIYDLRQSGLTIETDLEDNNQGGQHGCYWMKPEERQKARGAV